MQRIFLIGYMGSGKTTIGKNLSKAMGLQFIDLDLFIEGRHRKTVGELFAERGETAFREIEHRTLEEIAGFENIIISTGGGAPCFFDNMELMNRLGTTVYLKVSEAELADRLIHIKQNRPLIKDKNREELEMFISESLRKREDFYNQAKLVFDTEQLLNKKDVDNMVANLVKILNVMQL